MSYTPTNWESGDVVTSQKMNKLEQGVAGAGNGALIVNVTVDSGTGNNTCDKTAGEIFAAIENGPVVFKSAFEDETSYVTLTGAAYNDGTAGYTAGYSFNAGGVLYSAETATDYPVGGDK